MASKPLQELDMAALIQQRSQIKGILIAYAILWVVLLAIKIYLIVFRNANFKFVAIAFPLLLTIFPLLSSLSKINAEIKLRNANI